MTGAAARTLAGKSRGCRGRPLMCSPAWWCVKFSLRRFCWRQLHGDVTCAVAVNCMLVSAGTLTQVASQVRMRSRCLRSRLQRRSGAPLAAVLPPLAAPVAGPNPRTCAHQAVPWAGAALMCWATSSGSSCSGASRTITRTRGVELQLRDAQPRAAGTGSLEPDH